jgi:hypothetical protein
MSRNSQIGTGRPMLVPRVQARAEKRAYGATPSQSPRSSKRISNRLKVGSFGGAMDAIVWTRLRSSPG